MTAGNHLFLFTLFALILVTSVFGQNEDWKSYPCYWPEHKYDRHHRYEYVDAHIAYWTKTFDECITACKNDQLCTDYCSFRFGIAPTVPDVQTVIVTKWKYPFPIYVNGSWYFSDLRYDPWHPQHGHRYHKYPCFPQGYYPPHYNTTFDPHYQPYPPHHYYGFHPRRLPCYPYPPVCYSYKPEWCLKQLPCEKPYCINYYKPCKAQYKPYYKPNYHPYPY